MHISRQPTADVDLSYMIPICNEAESLDQLVRATQDTLARIDPALAVEVLLVDDGSRDSIWEQIERVAHDDARFCGIRLSRNFGH